MDFTSCLGGRGRVAWVLCLVGVVLIAAPGQIRAGKIRRSHNAVVLLFDVSGSMQRTDPACIRREAALLLLSMLDDGDRVAVIEFGDRITPVTREWIRLGDGRSRVVRALSRCRNREKYTDILGALRAATDLVEQLGDEGRRATPPSVIILTDGQDTTPRPEPGREAKIEETLRTLAGYGVEVHSVGLSGEADRRLLQVFNRLTGGDNCWVEDPRDLLEAFFSLSRRLGRRWLVKEVERARPGTIDLPVPPWATGGVLLFIPRGGRARDLLRVEETGGGAEDHGLYQVLRTGDMPGEVLRVRVPRPGGRLVWDVRGDLFLSMKLPEPLPLAIPFHCEAAVVSRDGNSLGDVEFLRRMNVEFRWRESDETFELYDNGRQDDGAPFDGRFGGTCVARRPGNAEWTARAVAPFSPSLDTTGKTRVVGEGEMVTISFSWNGRHAFLLNRTRVPIRVGVDVLDAASSRILASQDLLLEPGKPERVEMPGNGLGFGHATVRLRWQGEGSESLEAREVEVRGVIPSWLPRAAMTALLLLLGAGFLVPRRSLAGARVRVRVLDDLGTVIAEDSVRVGKAGPVRIPDVPEPFGDAGTFRPVHGFLRRGKVHWIPAGGGTPVFSRQTAARRVGRGYRLGEYARWKIVDGGREAEYTFRMG